MPLKIYKGAMPKERERLLHGEIMIDSFFPVFLNFYVLNIFPKMNFQYRVLEETAKLKYMHAYT